MTIPSEMEKGFYESGLPRRMWDGVRLYVLHGKRPGHFLQAVFANDLQDAFALADDENMALMREWVLFIYNYVPARCHGSRERITAWVDGKRGCAGKATRGRLSKVSIRRS
jgi:hypothetical protein